MTNLENVVRLSRVIGRPVVSVETANKLGQVNDLLIEPLSGRLAGFSVALPDNRNSLVSFLDVHGIGPDAIMVERDESLVYLDASPLKGIPRARANLMGVKVITEHGQLLGNISNLYLCLLKDPVLIYEVRSSIFDRLFRQAFYFAASLGCAFAADDSALVVGGAIESLDRNLAGAANRVLGPFQVRPYQRPEVQVEVRSRAD